MTLEEYIARLNGLAFWKEFTYAQNRFTPRPGKTLELADNLVWLGDYAFVLQLKQRGAETEDVEAERAWFRKKVLDKATSQIRDTLQFLNEHEQIHITNERGHGFDISGPGLVGITKIIVFLGGRALPEDCYQTRYYLSRTAGFVHILAAHDYLGILEKLRVPEDIRSYFAYREEMTPKLRDAGVVVDESDIMGAFLSGEELPTPISREILRQFVQDLEAFDLSPLIGNLHDHISLSEQPYQYYRIMLEFARVPRSVWREVKIRLLKCLDAVQKREFTLPFRLIFPATDCAFMVAALDPQLPATGPDGEKMRVLGLQNLTYAAKYEAKVSKGVGILISKNDNHIQIDWCLLDSPWELDPEVDAMLAKSYPFREAKERTINSFIFGA